MENNFVTLYSSKGKGFLMSENKTKNFFEKLHSNYWLGNLKYKQFNPDDTYSLVKMASFRRAVDNFVFIVTGKHMPIRYNKITPESYYSGREIVISADFKNAEVDGIVGVALHEASHVVKTDMEYFDCKIEKDGTISGRLRKKIPTRIYSEAKKKWNLDEIDVIKKIHRLNNWIEDRRIDRWQMKRAPGYRPYYQSMYKKYFRSPIIDLALNSTDYRDETFESYDFRITNFLNKNTDLNALKGLSEIWNTIDLHHISRLTKTKDSFEVALDVWDIIMNNITAVNKEKNKNEKRDGSESGEGSDSGDRGEKSDNLDDNWENSGDEATPQPQEISDEDFDKMLDKIEKGEYKENKNGVPIKLTPNQKKKLEKAIEKQKNFLEGNIDKGTPLTDEQAEQLNRIEKSGTSIEEANTDAKPQTRKLNGSPDKVPVIVVRELTESNINDTPMGHSSAIVMSEDAVDRGITMGNQLARKLIIRNESRKTILTRKKTGRIDKRLLSGLGYGTESIFQQRYVDQYGDALIHISVDASSSMNSTSKWGNALTTCVAIAKAAELIENLDVIVSFRTTTSASSGGEIPYILIAYDSRKDAFVKIRKLFPRLYPTNYTPEGLCFEAIMKDIIQSMSGKDGVFINFSDGGPCLPNPAFSNASEYGGEPAHRQTRSQVNKMISHGIKILSFFIGDNNYYSDFSGFKSAYGAAAKNIDTQSVPAVAREVNKMFTDNNKKYRKSL